MRLRGLSTVLAVSGMLAGSVLAHAEPKRSFIGTSDLNPRVLSSARIGPPAMFVEFAPRDADIAAEAPSAASIADRFPASEALPERAEKPALAPAPAPALKPTAEARPPAKPPVAKSAQPKRNVAAAPVRQKQAKRPARSNPLDAYARDTRRQSWPCRGDGICAWR